VTSTAIGFALIAELYEQYAMGIIDELTLYKSLEALTNDPKLAEILTRIFMEIKEVER